MGSEVRSAGDARRQPALWPELDAPDLGPTARTDVGRRTGVGARRRPDPGRAGGGGYLDGRTAAELRADPRLAELSQIGLQAHWIAVAEIVGYDAFIAMWRRLSADPALRDDDNQIALRLRPIRSWERYQRNRYIETLVACGMRPREIHETLARELGENLSYRQLKKLALESRHRLAAEGRAVPQSQPGRGPATVAR